MGSCLKFLNGANDVQTIDALVPCLKNSFVEVYPGKLSILVVCVIFGSNI